MKHIWPASLAVATALLSSSCAQPHQAPAPSDATVFINVNVIPMDSQRVLGDQTVVVTGGRITAITDASKALVPVGAVQIDADGQYLIPGFCDMHVHLEGDAWNLLLPPDGQFSAEALDPEKLLFPYIANGVTTVQILSALPEHVGLRSRVAAGEILGPRLLLSKMIDGPDRAWPPPISTWVRTPDEARQAVLDAHETGYDSMKVYSFLDREAYESIVATALEIGMGVGGHIPLELSLEEVLASGQSFIAHSEEFPRYAGGDFSRENIDRMAGLVAESGIWMTPTLITSRNILRVFDDFDGELSRPEIRYLHPMAIGMWTFIHENLYGPTPQEHRDVIRRGYEEFQRAFTLAYSRAGGRLMTGTDALIPSNFPGFGLHDELAELVGVGLSPYEALRATTTNPYEFLGELDGGGTVEEGKRADLVLLDANPLDDISNTRRIAGVMIGGRWIAEDDLSSGLSRLAEDMAALRNAGGSPPVTP